MSDENPSSNPGCLGLAVCVVLLTVGLILWLASSSGEDPLPGLGQTTSVQAGPGALGALPKVDAEPTTTTPPTTTPATTAAPSGGSSNSGSSNSGGSGGGTQPTVPQCSVQSVNVTGADRTSTGSGGGAVKATGTQVGVTVTGVPCGQHYLVHIDAPLSHACDAEIQTSSNHVSTQPNDTVNITVTIGGDC